MSRKLSDAEDDFDQIQRHVRGLASSGEIMHANQVRVLELTTGITSDA